MAQNGQDEAKLDAMQRAWGQLKRNTSSCLFDDHFTDVQSLLPATEIDASVVGDLNFCQTRSRTSDGKNKKFEPPHFQETHPQEEFEKSTYENQAQFLIVDASKNGDFPAQYRICNIESYQMPVIGVYVDRNIIPGFKYRVRPLPQVGLKSTINKCLFNNKAVILNSISRGYSRRFTFKTGNDNDHFWSDNRLEGYAFELEVISEGDKFTIFDTNKEAQGSIEIMKIEGPQQEISNLYMKCGTEKRVNVKFTGKVELYETGVAKPMPLNGIVIARKGKMMKQAEVVQILNILINRHKYSAIPGIQRGYRRVTVRGQEINDVPTKYSMTGLEAYELPVVGTYVDPRIIPGFCYKVRPNDRHEHLFNGRALKLLSIGMGYAKKLTFQPDSPLNLNNFLWSDNHPDGLGLEIRVIHEGMKFLIMTDGKQIIGEASVFRVDKPQIEEKMEKVRICSNKYAIEKYVLIDVMCHIKIEIPGGGSTANDEHLMRVCGLAVIRKEPHSREAQVQRIENVGLDSQLNVLFAQTHIELTFYPQ